MARAARIDLRTFQPELASRLAAKTAAQVESSRLGLLCAGTRWLIKLADAGEVVALPHIVTVPMTRAWFLGVAHARGNLFSVIDFSAFLGGDSIASLSAAPPVLFGARSCGRKAGLVVQWALRLCT